MAFALSPRRLVASTRNLQEILSGRIQSVAQQLATVSLTCNDPRNLTGLGYRSDTHRHIQTRQVLGHIDSDDHSNA
jgi:hypothetical protein